MEHMRAQQQLQPQPLLVCSSCSPSWASHCCSPHLHPGHPQVQDLVKMHIMELAAVCNSILMHDHEEHGITAQRVLFDVHKASVLGSQRPSNWDVCSHQTPGGEMNMASSTPRLVLSPTTAPMPPAGPRHPHPSLIPSLPRFPTLTVFSVSTAAQPAGIPSLTPPLQHRPSGVNWRRPAALSSSGSSSCTRGYPRPTSRWRSTRPCPPAALPPCCLRGPPSSSPARWP